MFDTLTFHPGKRRGCQTAVWFPWKTDDETLGPRTVLLVFDITVFGRGKEMHKQVSRIVSMLSGPEPRSLSGKGPDWREWERNFLYVFYPWDFGIGSWRDFRSSPWAFQLEGEGDSSCSAHKEKGERELKQVRSEGIGVSRLLGLEEGKWKRNPWARFPQGPTSVLPLAPGALLWSLTINPILLTAVRWLSVPCN